MFLRVIGKATADEVYAFNRQQTIKQVSFNAPKK